MTWELHRSNWLSLSLTFLKRGYIVFLKIILLCASQVALVVKNPSVNAGNQEMYVWSLGLEKSPGGGHRNPLQYSCLKNPMDRGAWQATVHRVTQSKTCLKQLSTHACMHIHVYKMLHYLNVVGKLYFPCK